MESGELTRLFQEHRALEQKTVESLSPMVSETRNSVVKLFLHRLVLDSVKHADIMQALIDLNTGAVVSNIDKHRMKRELKKHVENEEVMLNRVQNIIGKVEDERTRFLLQHIADDERRHHKILDQLLEMIEEIENIRDEDWWDLYYDRAEWLF